MRHEPTLPYVRARARRTVYLLGLCLTLSACDTMLDWRGRGTTMATQPLANTRWELAAYGEVGGDLVQVSPRPDALHGPYVLNFREEGKVGGAGERPGEDPEGSPGESPGGEARRQAEETEEEVQRGVYGSTGCNGFGGWYETGAEGALKIRDLAMTLMACESATAEGPFVEGLWKAVSYRRTGDTLEIFYPEDRSRVLLLVRR